MIRIAIGIKGKNNDYIPVGVYIDGSVKELTVNELNENECNHYNELSRFLHRGSFSNKK
ncbi:MULTISPECIES: hypothetical protein [Bacillus cereus group]|uniref:Uncharacterized protein n=1 Tax=Bacillus cereus (strain G9842) TaxID=405531 RepID=B7IZP6_BACC2|nr:MULTISPECIES: hypothetical protein [Bacillus cereus group]ACK98773.1 hypothetical protein BCG9842_A0053 [Bacillus cereus G9842]HDR8240573.1 hypothetical protein [Bacillus cereus]